MFVIGQALLAFPAFENIRCSGLPGLKFYCRFIFFLLKIIYWKTFFIKFQIVRLIYMWCSIFFCFVFMHEPEIAVTPPPSSAVLLGF